MCARTVKSVFKLSPSILCVKSNIEKMGWTMAKGVCEVKHSKVHIQRDKQESEHTLSKGHIFCR